MLEQKHRIKTWHINQSSLFTKTKALGRRTMILINRNNEATSNQIEIHVERNFNVIVDTTENETPARNFRNESRYHEERDDTERCSFFVRPDEDQENYPYNDRQNFPARDQSEFRENLGDTHNIIVQGRFNSYNSKEKSPIIRSENEIGFSSKCSDTAISLKTFSLVSLKNFNIGKERNDQLESELRFLKTQRELNDKYRCKNVMKYHEAFSARNEIGITIATDFFRFGTLQYWIDQSLKKHTYVQHQSPYVFPEKRLMLNWIASIAKDVLNGLKFLHSKYCIAHLDLQPKNIFIANDGRAVISNFSSSQQLDSNRLNYSDEVCQDIQECSILCMSPERLQQSSKCGMKSDIWSLGMTLVSCALGKRLIDLEDLIWDIHSNQKGTKKLFEVRHLKILVVILSTLFKISSKSN